MKLGLSLTGLSPRHYATVATAAEAAGFESVWVPDHLVFPAELPDTYLYTPDGRPPMPATTAAYDPWVLLATVTSVTTTLRVGTLVYVLPLRHPLVTARAVQTLDRVSHGRVTLGAGVGWMKDEYDFAGEPFETRGRRMDEIVPLMRRLWTEPVVEHHGDFYDIGPVTFEPKPFQQPVPVEIGGSSPAALRRAGRIGDGWIEIGAKDDESLAAMVAAVHEARREAGRDHEPFLVTAGLGADRSAAEGVRRAADLGVDRVIVHAGGFAASGPDAWLATVDRIATEVAGTV